MISFATQITAFIVGIAIGVAYYFILAKNSNDDKRFSRTLLICALSIIVINTIADMYVISNIAQSEQSWFSLFGLSVVHSLELFVFRTYFFDNGYQEFLFGINNDQPGKP